VARSHSLGRPSRPRLPPRGALAIRWSRLVRASHPLQSAPLTPRPLPQTGYALTADDGDGSWIASAVGSRYESENRGFQVDDDGDESDEY